MNMRLCRSFAVIAGMACAVSSVFATEYFVDANRPNNDGDGKSEATAKRTIQAAIDLATQSGDIVTVLPGVYTEGGDEYVVSSDTYKNKGFSRVCIKRSGITLRSKGGRDVTHIVGQKATEPQHASGMGTDAVRCVYVANITDTGTVRIEGFTIRDGYTRYDAKPDTTALGAEVPQNKGGGVCYRGDTNPDATKVFVVDCVITNCAGTRGGGAYGLTAVRTYFGNNKCSMMGTSSRHVRHYNCVFGKGETLAYHADVVNCTFVGYDSFKATEVFNGNPNPSVYNVLVQSAQAPNISGVNFSGSAFTAVPTTTPTEGNLSGVANDLMAASMKDLRPRTGTAVATVGVVSSLSKIPAEFSTTDYLGRPRLVDEEVAPGAFSPVTSVCSLSVLNPGANGGVTIDGLPLPSGTNFVYSDVWPTQYLVCAKGLVYASSLPVRYRQLELTSGTPADGKWSETTTRRLMPKWPEETLWLAPPENGHALLQIETSGFKWVDCVNGSDDNVGATRETAYKTFAKAHSAMIYGTIFVCPGVYSNEVYESAAGKCRFAFLEGYARAIAVEGPEKTIILGAPDPEAEADQDGCGPNAVRCVYGTANFSMQGFTLTGGYTGAAGGTVTVPNVSGCGGAAYGTGTSIFRDCIITNNHARRAAAVYGTPKCFATLYNCRISGNRTALIDDGAVRGCRLVGCVVKDNCSDTGAAAVSCECTLYNTTVIEPKTGTGKPLYDATSIHLYNSIVQGGVGPTQYGTWKGCVIDGFDFNGTGGYVRGNPGFVDPANGDYRLCNLSSALGAGVISGVTDYTYYFGNMECGPAVWLPEGRTVAGAYVEPPYPPSVSVTVEGGGEDGWVTPSGTFPVSAGQEIEITVTETTKRPFLGLEVDGTRYPASQTSVTITVPSPLPADWGTRVKALFSPDIYVDASKPDDTGAGYSWATARRTLKSALEYAKAGDTVHVAPGVYDEGEMLQATPIKTTCTPYLKARAVVPAGVTLISSNGAATAETTIIKGADAKTEPDQWGMGVDAVRGVFLETGAKLIGFTVTGGRVDYNNVGSSVPEDDNHHGAGILVRDGSQSLISDCIISTNIAPRAGGTRYGRYVHCRFIGNRATNNGSASRDCECYECYFTGQRGGPVLNFFVEVKGCTFAANTGNVALGGVTGKVVENCLFVDGVVHGGGATNTLSNCAFLDTASVGDAIVSNNCIRVPEAQLTVDENGVPFIGANAAIDAGDVARRSALCGGTDAAGNPRVSNAQMDIGCYEADWRPRYSTDLAPRRLTVTEASAEVYEGDGAKSVVIPQGSVTLEWANPSGMTSGTNQFDAQVSGTGTLAILLNGEPFATLTSADGLKTLTVALSALPVNELVFTYTPGENDTGAAEISNFVGARKGMMLIVR